MYMWYALILLLIEDVRWDWTEFNHSCSSHLVGTTVLYEVGIALFGLRSDDICCFGKDSMDPSIIIYST